MHGQRGARGVQGLHVDDREGARAVEADEDDVGPVVEAGAMLRVPRVERTPVTVALADDARWANSLKASAQKFVCR